MFEQIYRSLVDIAKEIEGATVENNKFCISVHYRNVDEKVGVVLSLTSYSYSSLVKNDIYCSSLL